MWFGKKPPATAKRTVKLKHASGEVISITIEGTNVKQLDYVASRIEDTFGVKPEVNRAADKVFDEADKAFKAFEDIFKHFK
jgi:hypothetical protein